MDIVSYNLHKSDGKPLLFQKHFLKNYETHFPFTVTASVPVLLLQKKGNQTIDAATPYQGTLEAGTQIRALKEDGHIVVRLDLKHHPEYQKMQRKYDLHKFYQINTRVMVPLEPQISTYDQKFVKYKSGFHQLFSYLHEDPRHRIIHCRQVYYQRGHYVSLKDQCLLHSLRKSTDQEIITTVTNQRAFRVIDEGPDDKLIPLTTPVFYFAYSTGNYLHFLKDTIPFLYWYLELRKDYPDLKLWLPLVPNGSRVYPYVYETLALFRISPSDLLTGEADVLSRYRIKNFFVVDTSKLCGEYPSLWDVPQVNEMYRMIQERIRSVPNLFRPLVTTGEGNPLPPKMVYISRRTQSRASHLRATIGQDNTQNRVLENEDELVELLGLYGVQEVFAEDYPFFQKVQLLNSCERVFTTYGAGIVTAVFTQGVNYTVFNSLSYTMNGNIFNKIKETNHIEKYNYFLRDRQKVKNCPWKIDLLLVEKLLVETYGLSRLNPYLSP